MFIVSANLSVMIPDALISKKQKAILPITLIPGYQKPYSFFVYRDQMLFTMKRNTGVIYLLFVWFNIALSSEVKT